MCTSEYGISYRNSGFHDLKFSQNGDHFICGGDYEKRDGSGGFSIFKKMNYKLHPKDPNELVTYFNNHHRIKIIEEVPKHNKLGWRRSTPNLSWMKSSENNTSPSINEKINRRHSLKERRKHYQETEITNEREFVRNMIEGKVDINAIENKQKFGKYETNNQYSKNKSCAELPSTTFKNEEKFQITMGMLSAINNDKFNTLFKIYLKDNNNDIDKSCFGKVVQGFDVLNKISTFNDIKKVNILDCGLVISLK